MPKKYCDWGRPPSAPERRGCHSQQSGPNIMFPCEEWRNIVKTCWPLSLVLLVTLASGNIPLIAALRATFSMSQGRPHLYCPSRGRRVIGDLAPSISFSLWSSHRLPGMTAGRARGRFPPRRRLADAPSSRSHNLFCPFQSEVDISCAGGLLVNLSRYLRKGRGHMTI
jgi:hypothetical protein